eukprot:Gb_22310 [translate_table: standard]
MAKVSGSEVFMEGPLSVRVLNIWPSDGAPKSMSVVIPTADGDYPVVLFQHGFMLNHAFYTQLLRHVASHGYIAVAPQMYVLTSADATREISEAAEVADWLPDGLAASFPQSLKNRVRPNFEKFVLAGHSRGGKVAFGLALGRFGAQTSLKLSALVGLDPVDGEGEGMQTNPPILTYKENSFDLEMPVLVVGSGLGPCKCNPEGVNHRDFYNECRAPAYHFVASDYGHLDFLNNNIGISGEVASLFCKRGGAKEPMRRFTGGILVAFLRKSLDNDGAALNQILDCPSICPVKIEPPQYILPKDKVLMSKL